MYSVGSSYARSGFELIGATFEYFQEVFEVLEKDGIRLLEEIAVGRIHYIRGCKSVVHPFSLFSQAFAYRSGKGYHVMSCLLFNLLDALYGECGVVTYFVHVFAWNHSELAPCITCEGFDFEVGAELVLFSPDISHDLA